MRAFGLDLSDQSLKLIELKKSRNKVELANFCDIALAAGSIVKGRIVKEDLVVASVRESLLAAHKGKVKTRFVVISVPEIESFIRIIKLPKLPQEELSQAVRWESEQHIPLSGSEVYLGWQKVGEKQDHLEVLVTAAPKKIIDSYIHILKAASLTPIACEVESAATVRSLVSESDKSCYLVVDIGMARTGLIIVDCGVLQFTASVEPFGQSFSEKIANDFKINLDESEKIKKVYGLDRQAGGIEGKVYKSLLPLVEGLAREITIAAKFYQDHFPAGEPIKKIILCGGGAKLKGLVPELKLILKQEVVLGNPWVNVLNTEYKYLPDISRKDSLGYTTAIGLALRGLEGI